MDQGKPKHKYRTEDEGAEIIHEEKDSRVLVGERLGMTHQCALAAQRAKCILDCSKRSAASKVRERILPLYFTLRPQLE